MKSRFFSLLLCLGAGLLALPGCGVYIPHAVPTPVLTAGQLEVKVAVAPLMSVSTATMKPKSGPWVPATEGYVAFSPVNHLFGVVAAGGNFIGPLKANVPNYYRERQADIGLGYYRPFGTQNRGYVAGTIGMGRGRFDEGTLENYSSVISIYGGQIADYQRKRVRYQRSYVQGHIAWKPNDWTTTCAFGRVTRVDFDDITEDRSRDGISWRTESIPISDAAWYFETGWSARLGRGAWQGAVEMMWSAALYAQKKDWHPTLLYSNNMSILTLGVIYRPQLFSRL